MGEIDDRHRDHGGFRFGDDVAHEGQVDLEGVDGKAVQVGKARIAGAEVVQRQPDAMASQGLGHDRRQVAGIKLAPGDIHRQPHVAPAGIAPGAQLLAGGIDDPGADRHDQTAFLGQRDEARRHLQAGAVALPADQGFGAAYLAGAQIHLGLVMEHEFLAFQCPPQGPFELQLRHGVGIHVPT